MQVTRNVESTSLQLSPAELRLLVRVLERASFIDTPVEEQADIAAFASRALDTLRRDGEPV